MRRFVGWVLLVVGGFYLVIGLFMGVTALIGPLTGRGTFIEGGSVLGYLVLPLLMVPVCWCGWKLRKVERE